MRLHFFHHLECSQLFKRKLNGSGLLIIFSLENAQLNWWYALKWEVIVSFHIYCYMSVKFFLFLACLLPMLSTSLGIHNPSTYNLQFSDAVKIPQNGLWFFTRLGWSSVWNMWNKSEFPVEILHLNFIMIKFYRHIILCVSFQIVDVKKRGPTSKALTVSRTI